MDPVTIYTRDGCSYCVAALNLLRKKNASFVEFNASKEPSYRAEMMQKSAAAMICMRWTRVAVSTRC